MTLFIILHKNVRPVDVFTTRELADVVCAAYRNNAVSRDYRVIEYTPAAAAVKECA